jgi:hypothetical protein
MKGNLLALFALVSIILTSAYEISVDSRVSDAELMQQVFSRQAENEAFYKELSGIWGERITSDSPKTIKVSSASKEMLIFLVN